MKELGRDELVQLSKMMAFVGNSLMRTIRQTEGPGLQPAFWAALPDFGSTSIDSALDDLFAFAERMQDCCDSGEDVVTAVSVEHTKLFVGPPSPAAAPWETYYPEMPEKPEGANSAAPTSGFGEPTFAMKGLLREVGLELSNENHQFEDHIGIELLYLSVLYERAAAGDDEAIAKAEAFITEHPGRWIDRLMAEVATAYPDGYIIRLLRLAKALMML